MNADSASDSASAALAPDALGGDPDDPFDQRRTPFLDEVLNEKRDATLSFHMPGHKGHMTPDARLVEYWGGDLNPADIVSMHGSIDYLHAPRGAILQAQRLAAAAYGADQTFWLINGSTVGNQAALMTAAGDGGRVIVPRASHRSIYAGLILSGASPVWIEPTPHPEVGFALATSTQSVWRLLQEYDNVQAVHITSPSYYGFVSDVAELAAMAHQHGALLLVDSAHGAHLGFHHALPLSAVQAGADMVIMSTHKTMSALTQSSMLHVKGDRVDRARAAQILGMLQSSSPNSLLLASLDVARMEMALYGRDWLERVLHLSALGRAAVRAMDGYWCYGDDLLGGHGIYAYDPSKLVIRVTETGLTGLQVADKLRHIYNIEPEFADLRNIICSVTIADTEATLERLIGALADIAAKAGDSGWAAAPDLMEFPARLPEAPMTLRQATVATSRRAPLDQCLGEICAESVIPYPPGIPLILPGEVIERPHLDYLQYVIAQGMIVVGPEDQTLESLRVVARR